MRSLTQTGKQIALKIGRNVAMWQRQKEAPGGSHRNDGESDQ